MQSNNRSIRKTETSPLSLYCASVRLLYRQIVKSIHPYTQSVSQCRSLTLCKSHATQGKAGQGFTITWNPSRGRGKVGRALGRVAVDGEDQSSHRIHLDVWWWTTTSAAGVVVDASDCRCRQWNWPLKEAVAVKPPHRHWCPQRRRLVAALLAKRSAKIRKRKETIHHFNFSLQDSTQPTRVIYSPEFLLLQVSLSTRDLSSFSLNARERTGGSKEEDCLHH